MDAVTKLRNYIIDAVKASAASDTVLGGLKTFIQVPELNALNASEIEINEDYHNNSNLFYSYKAELTGEKFAFDTPVVLMINRGANVDKPFSQGATQWQHLVQLIVAYPTNKKKSCVHGMELPQFCAYQLSYVLKYIGAKFNSKKFNSLNSNGQIEYNDDRGGFAIAWINLLIPECMSIDIHTVTSSCCDE